LTEEVDGEHAGEPARPAERVHDDPALTRAALLESALELFRERGFDGTPVQQIVERAGHTKGAFYHHFESKADVLRILRRQFLEAEVELLEQTTESSGSPADRLRSFLFQLTLMIIRRRALVTVIVQERRHVPSDVGVDDTRRVLVERLEALLREGRETGDFRGGDARVAVEAIMGMVLWTHRWYEMRGDVSDEEIAAELSAMVLDGLVRCPAPDGGIPT
jgi:AcrR family transcriptional regulator